MSWIFKGHSSSKKPVISRAVEKEYEVESKKIDDLDQATRKVYKSAKRCVEAMAALSKAEVAVANGLKKSSLCQHDNTLKASVDAWTAAVQNLETLTQEMNSVTKATMEGMKKFSGVFPAVLAATKKRETALQEYSKSKARAEKYHAKERTGPNIVKLEQYKKALSSAREEFERQHALLVRELPAVYDARLDFFTPSLQALIRSQVEYYSGAYDQYSSLAGAAGGRAELLTEEEYDKEVDDTLAAIRALSIVPSSR